MTHNTLTGARPRWRRVARMLSSEEGWAGTAIIYPAVVVFCLALFQFGFYYLAGTTAQSVADITYQQARSYQATDTDGTTAADSALAASRALLPSGHTTISRTATTVTVTITGQAFVILPGLPLPTVVRTRTGPIERWVPAP
jgi:hypothetical protein